MHRFKSHEVRDKGLHMTTCSMINALQLIVSKLKMYKNGEAMGRRHYFPIQSVIS